MHEFGHWILHYTGLTNASGAWYLFWSGIFGDATIFAGVILLLLHHNCHVKRCPRLGHTDPEHGHPACRRHHSQADKLGKPPKEPA